MAGWLLSFDLGAGNCRGVLMGLRHVNGREYDLIVGAIFVLGLLAIEYWLFVARLRK